MRLWSVPYFPKKEPECPLFSSAEDGSVPFRGMQTVKRAPGAELIEILLHSELFVHSVGMRDKWTS